MLSAEQNRSTHLSTPKIGIAREIKNIQDKLRHCITANPEEHGLPIFDKIEAVSFQLLASERKGRGHDKSLLSNRPTLTKSSDLVRSNIVAAYLWPHRVEGIESWVDIRN
jgi:hypothetical protein